MVDGIRYDEYLRAEGPEWPERIDNVRELITGAAEQVADEEGEVGLTPLDHFLQKAMLVAELDKLDPDADAVTLMTLHNAKGLEFPVVFITGLEDGLFPLAQGVRRSGACSRRSAASSTSASRAPSEKLYPHARRGAPPQRRVHALQASSFLVAIPEEMLEQRKTIKVRSSGRSFMQSLGGGSQWGNSRQRPGLIGRPRCAPRCWTTTRRSRPAPAPRGPGMPVTRAPRSTTPRRRRTPRASRWGRA